MTTESTHMTPEQKIIAIAEFEGFPTEEYRMEEGYINTAALPPYLTSRDAICGAVARLPRSLRNNFNSNLARLVGGKVYEVANDDDFLF